MQKKPVIKSKIALSIAKSIFILYENSWFFNIVYLGTN